MKHPVSILLLLILAEAAGAHTWYVEKDGTGDYTVIQHAVDAAAPGDTIRIGPGRYDDYTIFDNGVRVYDCYVNDNGKGLAYIGSGEETIIGPEEMYDFQETDSAGLWCLYEGMVHSVSMMVIEHVEYGVMISGGVDIANVTSRECSNGVTTHTELGGVIIDSVIEDCWDVGLRVTTTTRDLSVQSCNIVRNYGGTNVGMTSQNIRIDNCEYTDNVVLGIQYADGSTGIVNNCTITGSRYGITVWSGSEVEIVDSHMIPTQNYGLQIANGSEVSGSGNVIHGYVDQPAIGMIGSSITMSESHIIRDESEAVHLFGSGYDDQYTFDLRNNYWGTSEADSIAAWIWDAVDDPAIVAVVEYLPFYDHPVDTERKSLGDVKRMFR